MHAAEYNLAILWGLDGPAQETVTVHSASQAVRKQLIGVAVLHYGLASHGRIPGVCNFVHTEWVYLKIFRSKFAIEE